MIDKLEEYSIKYRLDEPMKKHTTLHVGGPAEIYVEPKTLKEFTLLLSLIKESNIPFFIIGAGSNLLVSDSGMEGAVIRLKGDFETITFYNDGLICYAGAGAMLQFLIKRCMDCELSGLECMAGIPGTVGGALVMNAGTNEGTISDNLLSVVTVDLDGKEYEWKKQELKFLYRRSSLEGKIITGAYFLLKKKSRTEILEKISENMKRRAKTQPLATFNAGSIFKNPKGYFAGKLIEECNLKGMRSGDAEISTKHANFIINNGKATSKDIYNLIMIARKKVYEKFSVRLELEIKLLGNFGREEKAI